MASGICHLCGSFTRIGQDTFGRLGPREGVLCKDGNCGKIGLDYVVV